MSFLFKSSLVKWQYSQNMGVDKDLIDPQVEPGEPEPQEVGTDSFMIPEWTVEGQDLHPGPPSLLPFVLYLRPNRSSHCFADNITFLDFFLPFLLLQYTFFHPCPSIITHLPIYYISKVKLFSEFTCLEYHK